MAVFLFIFYQRAKLIIRHGLRGRAVHLFLPLSFFKPAGILRPISFSPVFDRLLQKIGKCQRRLFPVVSLRPEQTAFRGQRIGTQDRNLHQIFFPAHSRLSQNRSPIAFPQGMDNGMYVVHFYPHRQFQVLDTA